MIDKIRQKKIELLKRKEKGAALYQEWVASMNKVCKLNLTPDKFLSLDDTERLRSVFFKE